MATSTASVVPNDSTTGDPQPPRFICHFCQSGFTRGDHLQRHLRSHEDDRAFVCSVCSKAFTRGDSLARHYRGRHANPDPDSHPRSAYNRISRACEPCSKSKLKCEGKQPCARCIKRRVNCEYTARTRRRVKPVLPKKGGPSELGEGVEASMEDTEPEQEDSIQSISLEDQSDVSNAMPTGHTSNENLYVDTHALDALSQAAGMATARFHQPDLELHRASEDAVASSSNVQDHEMTSDLTGFRGAIPSADGQVSPPASNIAQYSANNWSSLNSYPSPLDNMDYEVSWDQLADIAEWSTLDFNNTDPFLLPSTRFDMFPYNNSFPTAGPNIHLPQFYSSSWSNSGNDIAFGQTLDDGSGLSRAAADGRQISLSTPAVNSASPNLRSPLVTTRSGPQPWQSPQREHSKTPNNLALDDARQEQMLKNSGPWPTHWNPSKRDNLLGFPDMNHTPNDLFEAENFAHVESLSQNVYDDVVQCFKSVSSDQVLFKKFRESILPPLAAFDCFIQLYFEFFQPMYPILHQPTFNPSKTHIVLVLAVVSIGCRYSRSKEARRCALPLSELTRRAILQAIETDNSRVRETWLTQAQLLNNLSMLYSGDKRFLEVAQAHWGSFIVQTRRNHSLKEPVRPTSLDLMPLSGSDLEAKWHQWRHEEARTRLGYMVWGLDSQLAMFFDINSSMDMVELQRKLPVHEDVWEAPTPEAWKPSYLRYQGHVPDLHTALRDLKSERDISPAVGDLARIMIVQAVFATTWSVRRAFNNPLIQQLSPLAETPRRWHLQGQWRSMLDTLAAHPMMADESSTMASTVRCQTHHVTLLVYAPLTELLAFAGAEVSSSDKKEVIHQKLLAWVQDDNGRVARRAVLHASIIFNLIRTNSKSAFFEPFALLISTLTIWVYIQLKPTLDANVQTQIRRASISEREKQKTVRLDKPKDEQAMQMWVEDGADLRGHISDVGNIAGPGAGQRLLQVACKMLVEMEAWPLSQGFARVLSILSGKGTPVDKHG